MSLHTRLLVLGTVLAVALPAVAAAQAANLVTASTLAAQAERKPATVDQVLSLRAVSDVAMSPDGQWVAYTVTTRNRESNLNRSAVWLVSSDGGVPRQLTRSPQADWEPRWSPDSRYVAFLSDRDSTRRRLDDELTSSRMDEVRIFVESIGERQGCATIERHAPDAPIVRAQQLRAPIDQKTQRVVPRRHVLATGHRRHLPRVDSNIALQVDRALPVASERGIWLRAPGHLPTVWPPLHPGHVQQVGRAASPLSRYARKERGDPEMFPLGRIGRVAHQRMSTELLELLVDFRCLGWRDVRNTLAVR